MAGWLFGGWPPPPPALDTVTFAEVKAALALADSPVGFNGQPLTNIGRSAARNSAALLDQTFGVANPVVPTYEQPAPVIVAAGAFVTIPGPAAGFIRFFNYITLTSLGATPSYNITLEPSGFFICGRALTGGAPTAAAITIPAAGVSVSIGELESIKVANGGTASASLFYTYVDVSAEGLTLVRAQFAAVGNPAVEIVPAAPVGFVRRLKLFQRLNLPSWSMALQFAINNDDTAAVVTNILMGATQVPRVASTAANTASLGASPAMPLKITSDALSVQAQAAATDPVRRPIVFACYETIPIA